MLYFPATRIINSIEFPVASGSTITAEGAPLTWNAAAGGVKLSVGDSTDRFAGISLSQQLTPTTLPYVENLTIPGSVSYTVTTTFAPVGSTIFVTDTTTGTVQTAGNPATTDNTYSISGSVLTLHANRAGNTIQVTYSYSPTVQQVLNAQGNVPAGTAVSAVLGSTSVIVEGVVFTSMYDTSVNWATVAAGAIQLGVGKFTAGGSGQSIPGAYVYSLPSVTQPFLGLWFRA